MAVEDVVAFPFRSLGKIAGYISDPYGQRNALRELAGQMSGVGPNGPQMPIDRENALSRYAQITGDVGPLFGIGDSIPAAVKETQWLLGQSKPVRDLHLAAKRAQQFVDLGGEVFRSSPFGGLSELYKKTLPPQNQPRNIEEAAEAGVRGRGEITDTEKKSTAKEQLSSLIDDTLYEYGELNKLGGITSSAASPLQNLGAKISGSGIGGVVGSTFATPEAVARENIKSKIPLIMSAIKSATGKSASEINSIPEMELLKKSVSDPSQPYEVVIKTLNDLDSLYGIGKQKKKGGAVIPKVTGAELDSFPPGSAMPPSLPSSGLPDVSGWSVEVVE